jgi:Gram-negative bacterial TonB protein C-terminal
VIMDVQLPRPISRIVFRCSEQTKAVLVSKMEIHEGSMLTDELLQQARKTAKACNEWLAILVRQSIRQEEYLKSAPELRKTFIPPAIDEGVNVVVWDRATPPQRVRVDGSEHNSRLIERTMPTHGGEEVPTPAVVKLAIIIGKDGRILEIDPLAGPDSLISSAVDAVRRWKYQPTLLNGRPVEVETTVEVPFPAG